MSRPFDAPEDVATTRPADWLRRVQDGDRIWLVKERCYAVIALPYYPSYQATRLGQLVFRRMTHFDHLLPNNEIWFVDPAGHGFDGSCLMLPLLGEIRPPLDEALPIGVAAYLSQRLTAIEARLYNLDRRGDNPVQGVARDLTAEERTTITREQAIFDRNVPVAIFDGQPVRATGAERMTNAELNEAILNQLSVRPANVTPAPPQQPAVLPRQRYIRVDGISDIIADSTPNPSWENDPNVPLDGELPVDDLISEVMNGDQRPDSRGPVES